MAVITIDSQLDVLEKYNDLIQQSLGGSSVYIRTKETLEEFFKDSNMKDSDKAQIISNVLAQLNTSLVNASMSTALQWAGQEKDIALKKLELEKQLDILGQDILLKQAQVQKMEDDTIATQAQTIRMYGTPTVVDGDVVSLADAGKVYEDILAVRDQRELVDQQTINAVKEGLILDGKKKESEAAIHKVVADTYRNYGSYTFTLGDNGLTNVVYGATGYETLSDLQAVTAKEQASGYSYNAWANALTGSANMIAAGMSSGYVPTTTADDALITWKDTLNKLRNVTDPYQG